MLEQWNNGSLKSSMAENQFSISNDHCYSERHWKVVIARSACLPVGRKRRACTPKWRYGTQAWQSLKIASLRSQ